MLCILIYIVCGSLLLYQNVSAASISELHVTEAPPCSEGEFRCMSGACVEGDSRCNGTAECADASDETFILCRNDKCSAGQFRCAYGACANGGACDGVRHCRDNSDEELTRCLPETNRTVCDLTYTKQGLSLSCHDPTDCENGEWLAVAKQCDGRVDCADGSDETIARCGEWKCANDTFRCAYGGCANVNASCNGKAECADGSDELAELCDSTAVPTASIDELTTLRPLYSRCTLPPPPEKGSYEVHDGPDTTPRRYLDVLLLKYSCNRPYKLVGSPFVYCRDGVWSENFPVCKSYCKLRKDPVSIEYRCLLSGNHSIQGYRECNYKEPEGTEALPVCRGPNYYYPGTLKIMHCEDSKWNYIPMCIPECGRVTPKGMKLVADGRVAEADELPWQASIYRKPHKQICGGSVISTKVIISAAHCFWDRSLQPPSNYAVAVGKLSSSWYDVEEYAQYREVLDLKIPPRYQGMETRFQDDIALVILKTGLQFSVHVRPICVDFDPEFDTQQLQPGTLGKVAGWGLTSENSTATSPILRVVEIPYVDIEQCIRETPYSFKNYITSDTICAGYGNGTAVCRGDSGGGLSFPDTKSDVTRYYLRGIVSKSPESNNNCNTYTITGFTHVLKHERFIKSHFSDFTETGFRYFDSNTLTRN